MLKPPKSHYLCTGSGCREADSRTINEFGIDGLTLMEIAGARAADFILQNTTKGSSVLIFCGKGNNGGDALVVARLLAEKGYKVALVFAAGINHMSEQAQHNFNLLQKLKHSVRMIENPDITEYDFVIDGMLGTGLNSHVKSPYFEAVQYVNESEKTVFALDIPTGLHADTGKVQGICVKADYTLTFGALKQGFYLNDGLEFAGKVVLCELPFPNEYIQSSVRLIDPSWVDEQQPAKKHRRHKYDGGVLYVIAGSEGLTGAAILTSLSAWAAGVGAVILITPKGLLSVYENNLVQVIKKPVGTAKDVFYTTDHLPEVLEILSEKEGTLLMGPGLGRNPETVRFVQQLCTEFTGKMVLDADALYALSKWGGWSKPAKSEWILTPHPGELSKLIGENLKDDYVRLERAREIAQQKKVTLLSKGYPGIVATENGEAYLTGYDTRVFNRAGFGDVLTGKVGAYFLESGDTVSACIKALLDGHEKAEAYESVQNHYLEPLNLI